MKTVILQLFILFGFPALTYCQDLVRDLNIVSRTYKTNDNYILEWFAYTLSDSKNKSLYVIKKCDDIFYLEGNGEVSCINGKRQVAVNRNEKFVFYMDNIEQELIPDPMNFIKYIYNSVYKPILASNNNSTRHYKCYTIEDSVLSMEIWIDIMNWKVTKVIQYFEEELENGYVLEFKKYAPVCDIGPETNIQSYVRLDKNKVPFLVGEYVGYKLYTKDNFSEN